MAKKDDNKKAELKALLKEGMARTFERPPEVAFAEAELDALVERVLNLK